MHILKALKGFSNRLSIKHLHTSFLTTTPPPYQKVLSAKATPSGSAGDKEAPYFEIPRDHLNRRHYEETNSLGPKTAQSIADTFEKMIQRVNEAKNN